MVNTYDYAVNHMKTDLNLYTQYIDKEKKNMKIYDFIEKCLNWRLI